MPAFDVRIEGKQYHVEIPDPGAKPLRILVDGQSFEVSFAGTDLSSAPASGPHEAPGQRTVAAAPPPTAALPIEGGNDVRSPMPGTIISIDVTAGQHVEPGQVLCVLEAMKMKNPVRAGRAGSVAEIRVQPGQTVAYGDCLIRLA